MKINVFLKVLEISAWLATIGCFLLEIYETYKHRRMMRGRHVKKKTGGNRS